MLSCVPRGVTGHFFRKVDGAEIDQARESFHVSGEITAMPIDSLTRLLLER